VDLGTTRPTLKGKLHSKLLDIADLGGLIGEKPGEADVKPTGKVLPAEPINLDKLRRIDANVTLTATQFRNRDKLPLDNLNMKIVLVDGVMKADPLVFGVAGGNMDSRVAVDSRNNKALVVDIYSALRSVHINQLVPGTDLLDSSFGAIDGKIQLKGHGNSAATVLGTSNGRIDLVSRGGEMSNLMMEFAGLDVGEIVKFFVGGDQNVKLECAVAAFNVKDGVMVSEAFVIDTDDTYIGGQGTVSLRDETIDMKLTPLPKDFSILAFRGPLRARGTFAQPKFGVDKGSLARRAGAAVLLGLIHPLAGLIATIETGPGRGKNAPCADLIASLDANIKGGQRKPVPEEHAKKFEANAKDTPQAATASPASPAEEAGRALGGKPDSSSAGSSRP
jgi:AsmA family protein